MAMLNEAEAGEIGADYVAMFVDDRSTPFSIREDIIDISSFVYPYRKP
jgi:hypothetical protein